MMLLPVVLLAACGAPSEEPVDTPSAYVLVYAAQFVEAMRADGVEAGAFEIGKEVEEDGCYHLLVDVTESGATTRTTYRLRPEKGGLIPEDPGDDRAGAWHAAAAKAATEEVER